MKLLTVKQLRDEKGIPFSRQWLHELSKKGKFPRPMNFKGKRVFWLESDINEWLENMRP